MIPSGTGIILAILFRNQLPSVPGKLPAIKTNGKRLSTSLELQQSSQAINSSFQSANTNLSFLTTNPATFVVMDVLYPWSFKPFWRTVMLHLQRNSNTEPWTLYSDSQ